MLAAPSASVPAPAALTLMWAEPTQGGKLAVQRVGAANAQASARWRLNLDVAVRNTGRRTVTWVRSQVCYPGVGILCLTSTLKAENQVRIDGGGSAKLIVRENREHAFPVAPAIRVALYFTEQGSSDELALVVNRSLTLFQSAVAGGAYLFPGRKSDLPADWYWADNQSHLVGSAHRGSTGQRFAYDFGVRRWNGEEWTARHPGKAGSRNTDYLIWNMPVYAMADGWIRRCNRTVDENPKPGVKGTGGGNDLLIVHADAELALYAHFRKGTIPAALCPREQVDVTERGAVRVKAGQFLGRAGNSGRSSGPHLHVHVTSARADGQGLPLQFRNIRTRFAGSTWRESKPCDRKTPSFGASTAPIAAGWRQLVDPLWPAGAELTRSAVREPCFQDVADGAIAAGYRPVWFDGYDVAGKAYVNAVFRPGGGQWLLRSNLSAAAYQSELSNWVGRGYVPSLVESYQTSDSVRYAFLAEKRSHAGIEAYHGRSAADHETLGAAAQSKGRVPVAVAVVSRKGKLLYTAFWEKRDLGAWRSRSAMTSGQYQAWLTDQAKAGRRLVYLNAYHHDGKARFSAIVSSKAPSSYVARHDLPGAKLQSEYELWTGQGRRTQLVTGYNSGKNHRFAALWR